MISMLDKRAQILLKTLIERYIAEGQPIGSRTLSKYSGLDLSPATIRNVMADLEELGFIASPHTSAGRVPTPLGYRFFVDTLLIVKPLESDAMHRLELELRIELESLHDAEAIAQRRCQQPGTGRRPYQREWRQIQLDRARCRSLADHDV